jgi:hypothetical protein
MRFPHFFIDRPIFAAVLAVFIVLAGALAVPTLPIAQYPEIAPPTVVVAANYPGASAETLAETVATPLEEAINGVEGMIYMSSSSTGDGNATITVTFRQGTNVDQAQVLVQNRVATAEPRLPDEVRQIGVTVRKNSPDILMIATLTSPDGSLSQQFVSNYASLQLLDRLNRVPGVASAAVLGGRNYNMRVWIDPDRAMSLNLTVDEIVAAVRAQNTQVAAGGVGQPPFSHGGTAFQLSLQAQGRLTTPEEFGDIVVKRLDEGRVIHLRDVARLELGADDYTVSGFLSGKPAIAISVTQLPSSNSLSTARAVQAELAKAAKDFPPGLAYSVPYNPTTYIAASIDAVEHTLFEAIVLVALVVLLFLQSWRAAIIPVLAIPVSLVGSFATLAAFGFSLNNLSLFGMVLAIGIVVDDAIVVIENIERLMVQEGLSPREAAHRTMDEVSGALIAIALVLIGVFLPTILIPGISGQFYKQFALTIMSATAISAFVSLTLSPAIASLLLKPKAETTEPTSGWRGAVTRLTGAFNGGFDRLSDRYGRYTGRAVRALGLVAIVYVALIGLTGWRLFVAGRGTERDVREADVLLAQTNATVPIFEAERQAALYALAVLTGEPPTSVDAAAAQCAAVPIAKEPIPIGDGRSLLARRPDVRAAERTLAGNVARIGVSTAELYPTVTLAGTVTLGAAKLSELGSSQSLTYSYGPLISWNIPLNGAARARVRESKAQAQASLAAFDGTVLAALLETEQALTRLNGAVAREQALAQAAAASERAADLSDTRFRAGSDNFLQLLQAQRDRANAQADLAQAQADRAAAQIALFKALGGGWENAPAIVSRPFATKDGAQSTAALIRHGAVP